MRNTVTIISNIAMLLCTAAAVFLSLNQMLFPAVILLIIAVFFFVLKLVINEYSEEGTEEKGLHYDRTAKYMRICPACGFVGSQLSSESVPPCPRCKATLIATDTMLTEFTGMTEKQRTAWKRRWLR